MTDPAPLDAFRNDRGYLGADHDRNARRTGLAAAVCVGALALQIWGGIAFGSVALVAAGLHMAAHVAALAVAGVAYVLARRLAGDPRFTFGAGKVGALAGFANAVVLAFTALYIAIESGEHLFEAEAADYPRALAIAAAGLAVNLLCMAILAPARRPPEQRDLNLSAAHLHISADALVSVLVMAGLAAGWLLGWTWADAAAGLAGAVLVAQFALTLIRRAAAMLLDMNPSPDLAADAKARLEAAGARVIDLHLWRLGPGHLALIAAVEGERDATAYRALLDGLSGLSHVTLEVRPPALTRPGPSV